MRLASPRHIWLNRAVEPSLFDYVLAKLKASNGRWRQIADAADVPYDTLTKVALGRVKNPRIETVQKLADYFRAEEQAA